jgi:hypothetical protein
VGQIYESYVKETINVNFKLIVVTKSCVEEKNELLENGVRCLSIRFYLNQWNMKNFLERKTDEKEL